MNRRRTDPLSTVTALPEGARDRARLACDELAKVGLRAACAMIVEDGITSHALLCAGAGRVDRVGEVARGLAAEVVRTGRAFSMLDAADPMMRLTWRYAAIPLGQHENLAIVLVVADPDLTRREVEAIAAWLAPGECDAKVSAPQSAPSTRMIRDLASAYDADVVVLALFAQVGMLLNMYVRSGALLRTWRAPLDTVWGEAARNSTAMLVGDLHLHPGAESLASMGLTSAAIVGLDNGGGLPLGAVGVAATHDLDIGVAQQLLHQAGDLGTAVMQMHSRTAVPQADAEGNVDARAFAARVGCRRFAVYRKRDSVLELVSAHTEDGSPLISPPDEQERHIVTWAAQQSLAVSADDAAAIVVGEDTILYAYDPTKKAMECLRLALQDLQHSPRSHREAA